MGSPDYTRPLYPEAPWLYWDVEAVIVMALFKADSVRKLLPRGVEVHGDEVMGAVWVARYPRSTLGPYNEALIALQVYVDGDPYFYIPYIYVDSDAALAAGREVAGAPKKFAEISLGWHGRSVVGVARRAGMRIEAEVSPEQRAPREFLEGILSSEGTPLLSVRRVPPVGGEGGSLDLVSWHAKIWFHEAMNDVKAWVGSARVKLESGAEDSVGDLEVTGIIDGFYAFFDMELGVDRIIRREEYAG